MNTFRNSLTITGIYENRNKGLVKAFTHLCLFTLLIYFPLAWDWLKKDTLDYASYGITFVSHPPESIIKNLPDCYFENRNFYCNENAETLLYNGYEIRFLEEPTTDQYILFQKESFVIFNNTRLEFSYSGFKNIHFTELSEMDDLQNAAKLLADSLFVSIRNNLYLPILIPVYFIFIFMNLIYLLLLAGLSMSFKYKAFNFPNFKEVLTMYMFAVTYPSIIALFFTLITGSYAFTPVIMNFFTPVMMYIVYRKNIRY